MWSARLWYLVALVALALAAGGAATLTAAGDAGAQAERARRAEHAAERLLGELDQEMAARRAAARLVALDPVLNRLRAELSPDMPAPLRQSLAAAGLKKLATDHPRYQFAWLDDAGTLVAATLEAPAAEALRTAAPVARARAGREGRLEVGFAADGEWLVAVPLAPLPMLAPAVGPPAPADATASAGVLVLVARAPVAHLLGAHGALGDDLLKLAPYGPGAAAVPAGWPMLAPAPGTTATAKLGDAPHTVRGFEAKSVPGLSFALAWPAPPTTDLAAAGGPGAVVQGALRFETPTLVLLGAALLAWVLGVLVGTWRRQVAVGRVVDEVALATGAQRGDGVDLSRVPGWLLPLVRAVNGALEAAQAARRAAPGGARTPTGDDAPRPSSPPESSAPSLEKSVERPAEKSVEKSAERSSDASAERSAERSSEKAAEKSAEKSAERSSEKAAEKSAERSSEKAAEKSAERSSEKAAEKSAERSSEQAAEKSAERSSEKAAEASAAKSADPVANAAGEAGAPLTDDEAIPTMRISGPPAALPVVAVPPEAGGDAEDPDDSVESLDDASIADASIGDVSLIAVEDADEVFDGGARPLTAGGSSAEGTAELPAHLRPASTRAPAASAPATGSTDSARSASSSASSSRPGSASGSASGSRSGSGASSSSSSGSSSSGRPGALTGVSEARVEVPAVQAGDAADDDDEEHSDADIRLPGRAPRKPAVGGLLAQLQRQGALTPSLPPAGAPPVGAAAAPAASSVAEIPPRAAGGPPPLPPRAGLPPLPNLGFKATSGGPGGPVAAPPPVPAQAPPPVSPQAPPPAVAPPAVAPAPGSASGEAAPPPVVVAPGPPPQVVASGPPPKAAEPSARPGPPPLPSSAARLSVGPAPGGEADVGLEPSLEARPLPISGDRTQVRPVPIDQLAARDPDRTSVGPPPEDPAVLRQREAYFRSVFDEFLVVKIQCGEGGDSLEYPRFRVKLVRTRETLMQRFQCPDVRFRVYVKDGKAALRAAPVLDPS